MRLALPPVDGRAIESIALDTPGSSIMPVGENLVLLNDYDLGCGHRACREADAIW